MAALSNILDCIEKQPLLHNVLIRLITHIDPRLKAQLLRMLNPSFTVGALAVIVDPKSPPDDPVVLLGYHPYRDKEAWDLLGGAFKREDTDPACCLLREVSEETKLAIEVVDPIAVNVDKGIVNFYFECILRHGYPNLADALVSPEITELGWFKVSALPSDMSVGNRQFLTNVYVRAPKLAGASWTVQHQPSPVWRHLRQAEDVRSTWGVESDAPGEMLAGLLEKIETRLDSLKRRLPLNGDQDLREITEEMSDSVQKVEHLLRELGDPLLAETTSRQPIHLPNRRLTGGRRNGWCSRDFRSPR